MLSIIATVASFFVAPEADIGGVAIALILDGTGTALALAAAADCKSNAEDAETCNLDLISAALGGAALESDLTNAAPLIAQASGVGNIVLGAIIVEGPSALVDPAVLSLAESARYMDSGDYADAFNQLSMTYSSEYGGNGPTGEPLPGPGMSLETDDLWMEAAIESYLVIADNISPSESFPDL